MGLKRRIFRAAELVEAQQQRGVSPAGRERPLAALHTPASARLWDAGGMFEAGSFAEPGCWGNVLDLLLLIASVD